MSHSKARFVLPVVGTLLGAGASAQVTQRVDVDSQGLQANLTSVQASISSDGRYVAFLSEATNLVPGHTGFWADIFVRDRQTGTTEIASVATGGAQGNDSSLLPSISADGRYVAFVSYADDLVPGDTNDAPDVFVHDRLTGTTERVSVSAIGAQGDGISWSPSISGDGRFVAFGSLATNLVPGDTNGVRDIFVRDRVAAMTEMISVDPLGVPGNGDSIFCSISADGRHVAFESVASNLVAADTTLWPDVFVRDRQAGTTELVSVDSGGAQANAGSGTESLGISADARYVVFDSGATNLVAGDTNNQLDVFVHDRQSGATERVSVSSGGVQGDNQSGVYGASISADGRYVAFGSNASNLFASDTNGSATDLLVRDRVAGTTERVSVSPSGAQGNLYSHAPSISADGRYVAFDSDSTNLHPADQSIWADVYVRDRTGGPGFTSLCDPGVAGVIGCPCGNPPSGAGRGCDNSSGTGGARLRASGGTYLSSDTLSFTTSGERPTALSIVTQWTGPDAAGAVFGQGVRCTSGTFKRLYTKSAVGGSVTAPDFDAGELQVSVRAAALGDVLSPGQSRWHFVYYRDPNVPGGCPAASTFNATQTGEITWSP